MTSIRETVQSAIREAGLEQYAHRADPVIEALTRREQLLSESLLKYAIEELDVEAEDVRTELEQLGMELPPQAAATNGEAGDDDIAGTLRQIKQQMAELTEFARRNGYRG